MNRLHSRILHVSNGCASSARAQALLDEAGLDYGVHEHPAGLAATDSIQAATGRPCAPVMVCEGHVYGLFEIERLTSRAT